jgi:hypothetical protein
LVTVKDLEGHSQEQIALTELSAFIQARRASPGPPGPTPSAPPDTGETKA